MEENRLNLVVTDWMVDNLLSAMKWLKFLTIVACVGIGFIVLAGLSMMYMSMQYVYGGGVAFFMGFMYLAMAAIYFYPIKKSFSLISRTRSAMAGDQSDFEWATDDFKSILKYIGILTIVLLSIYAVIILLAIVSAATISTL